MKIYEVGGAVRDYVMNKKPHDFDYVVVGSSPQEMIKSGFIQVGKSFPVFLHPETKAEYALARKERKTGNKHTDFEFEFSPDITLSEDLRRRDFTCNALAKDIDSGEIIDETGGIEDIRKKVLRHIDAFHFVEDPLRVLRMCRFSAQLGFDIDPETMVLAKKMVADGMLLNLSAERFREEFLKALQSERFSLFIKAMEECGALKFLLTELSECIKDAVKHKSFYDDVISVEKSCDLIKFAALFRVVDDAKKIVGDCNKIRISKDFKEFALKFNKYGRYFIKNKVSDDYLYDMLKDLTRLKYKNDLQLLFEAFKVFAIDTQDSEYRCDKIFALCQKYKVNQLPNFAELSSGKQIQQIYKDFILQNLKKSCIY